MTDRLFIFRKMSFKVSLKIKLFLYYFVVTPFDLNIIQPIDPKRDEIRRYLERGSVLDSLTKIFIRIIKERPEDPMEYIRNNIGVVRHQHDKYERLSQDLQDANEEIQRLRGIINSINPEVLQGQSPHAIVESDDSEPVAVAEQTEALEKAEISADTTQIASQNTSNGVDKTTVEKAEELAVAVENCHIGENNVVAEDKIDSANQSSSVQAEPESAQNTE